ncbi:MAG: serpin family protein [Bacteroidales bacterium]|nr:serpin family protein [Bacteroidales bacterium]
MKKQIWSLLFIFLILSTAGNNAFSQDTSDSISLNSNTKLLIRSNNQFGLDIFKEVATHTDSTQNFMISPLSATLALSMIYNGAEGTTKTAFENSFHFSGLSTDIINKSLNSLCKTLTETGPEVTFNLANSIWYNDSFRVDRRFLKVNEKYYDANVLALDFNNPGSVKMINYWVNGKTNGKIPTIIRKIDPMDKMILINTTYFKGKWLKEFNQANTTEEPFTLQNGKTIRVPTMMQETTLGYLSNDLFTAIELPYGNRNFSMVLMLPNKGKRVQDIENAINQKTWNQWTNELQEKQKMYIHLPKFKFEFEKILNDALSKLGLGIAFSNSADFSKINPTVPLNISMVKQKTFIEVNELGTEAAAATAIIMKTTALRRESVFFNRPFLFAIKENTTNTILFIGRVMDPSQN